MKILFFSRSIMTNSIIAILFLTTPLLADTVFDKFIDEKKYNEAINYADEKIDPSERTASIWVKLGVAYDNLNMPEKSLACFLVSWRIDQKDYHSLLGAARAYNKLENPEMALEMAKKALDIKFTAEAGWEYARACIVLKRSVEAKKALAKVVETDSSNAIAVSELSAIYFTDGEWSKAIPLMKLMQKKKASGDLAFKIGKAYTELGVSDSAVTYLIKAQDSGKPTSAISLMLGRAYYGKKKWGDCAGAYRNTLVTDLTASDLYRYAVAIENTQGSDSAYSYYVKAVESFGASATGFESLLAREKVATSKIKQSLFSDAALLLQQIIAADPRGTVVTQSYCLLAEAYQGYNDLKNAIATLEKAIEINSRNIEAYARLGDLYQSNGMGDKAQKIYAVMISLSPNDPSLYLVLGEYNLKARRYKDALQHFEKSNTLKQSAMAQQGIACAQFGLKNNDQAFSAAEAALKLDGALHDARLVMASIQFQREKFAAAKEQYEKLLRDEPDNLEILTALSKCYSKIQDADKLYSTDKKIAQLKSDDVESRLRLAHYAASKNKIDEALGYYHDVVKLTPESPDVLRQAGLLSRKIGLVDDARMFVKRYLLVKPDDAEAHRDYGDLLYENKNFDGALSEYRTALKLNPAIKGFHKRYAEIVIAKGEQEEVIKSLSTVIAAGNADVATYMTVGLMYQKKREYSSAIKMYQDALKLEPSNFDALAALATCQAAKGDTRDAIITYEQAVLMNPQAYTELKELGDLYAKENRHDEAMEIYMKYCEKDSSNPVVVAYVGRNLFEKGDNNGAVRYYGMAGKNLDPDDVINYASACIVTGKIRNGIEALLPLKVDKTLKNSLQQKTFRLLAEAFEKDSDFVAASSAYGDYVRLPGVDDIDAAYKQAALLEGSDPVGAVKIYELNSKKYPSDYRNFLRLAFFYSERNDMLSKAIPLFKRVTELADSIPMAWLEMGKIYGQMGDDSEELRAYRKYAEYDPQNADVNRRIGTILLRKGQVNEGIVFLEIANTIRSNDPEIMSILASGYVRTNRSDEAISLLNKAKSKKKDDPDIRFQLFELYQKRGEKEKAQKEIQELVNMNHEPRYMLLYAEALIMQGKINNADTALEELLSIDPENIKTLLLKGRVLRLQKKFDDAIEIYKEISLIDPESALPLFERAETHLEQGKPQWAETFYKRALRLDPAMARAELGLAKIAKSRKDLMSYREHLENARKFGPDDEGILEELKKAGNY